ncbi:MAG TPA: DUF3455 domain-containing protein [Stellaceae bacterium]|nr:DUF3455 domain-containing protein [Stellaceae bacterium]
MINRLAAGVVGALIWCGVATPAEPENGMLAPPAGARLLLRSAGDGVQIYICRAKGDGFAWVFQAPEATLVDETGRKAAKHFAGPSWEAEDGSIVVGDVAAKADAPSGSDIPWLLLRAKSHSGSGRFTTVAFIQRLNTKGGAAPEGGCDVAHRNAEARVHYSATYVFYAAP